MKAMGVTRWLLNEDLRNHVGCRLESNDPGTEGKGEKREITNLNTLQKIELTALHEVNAAHSFQRRRRVVQFETRSLSAAKSKY
jgi:hypothetical protein